MLVLIEDSPDQPFARFCISSKKAAPKVRKTDETKAVTAEVKRKRKGLVQARYSGNASISRRMPFVIARSQV
jgi:hypothetical protein